LSVHVLEKLHLSKLSTYLSTTGGIVMNKKLLAPAIVGLLASGAACAEAGLTLYGNIDASVVTASGIGDSSSRRTSFGEGNWAPSVWGLKGTEDLGGGMKAHVWLEGGFNAGNGGIANGGTTGLFSRLANVGLSGSLGSVSAGLNLSPFIAAYTSTLALAGNNFYVPALQMHRTGTVLNRAAVTVPVYPGGTDADPALGTTGGFFIPNSITYTLPSELLRGATASVLYALGGVPGSFGENRFASGNLGYAFGELTLVAAISDRDSQYRQWLLGASAPVGPMKVAANFVRFSPQTGERTQTYTLGASMRFMPNGSVGVNYARNDGPGHPSIINVSAVYEMSKTMNLYAAFNRATDGVSSSYSAIGDAAADPTLTQTGTSNAVIIGLQKGF
jgi:predicted porin